ncbi:corrinoid protein [Desulfitobacterium sp. AusDCA]|uniref:corrinoid protein n=1 Tax=Desulfitobacterium sp. AusDCA TaxID=3240383 RepID=UPI003DA714B0
MQILDNIKEALMSGNADGVRELVTQALNEGLEPMKIIEDGLIAAMNMVGTKFRNDEIFVPEVLIAARAMHSGMDVVKPLLAGEALSSKGTVLIGTVKGDLHDIGKNLVSMMFQGGGLNVIDLGINVPAEDFAKAVEEHKPQVVAISALLTSTMPYMKNIIDGLDIYRDNVKIIVGGAPVTAKFAEEIGADAYAPDAASAVEKVRELLEIQ